MRLIWIFLLLFSLSSCSSTKYWDTTAHMEGNMKHPVVPLYKDYEHYLNSHGLIHVSSGITEDEKEDNVVSFHQMAIYRKLLSQDQARELLVKLVGELVERINSDASLKPHLIAHPISASRVEYTLLMTNAKGAYVPDDDYIAKVTLMDGLVRYYAHGTVEKIKYRREERQPEDDPAHIVEIDQETFQSAQKIIGKKLVKEGEEEAADELVK